MDEAIQLAIEMSEANWNNFKRRRPREVFHARFLLSLGRQDTQAV